MFTTYSLCFKCVYENEFDFCILNCSGLVVYSEGPLNLDHKQEEMSELFRPFQTLLRKIRQVMQNLV